MSVLKSTTAIAIGASLLLLAACGGGGGGGGSSGTPLLVTSTSIPPRLSGQDLNFVIPIQGGCGGPYVMTVIDGALPPGTRLDAPTHSIQGTLLQDGNYQFRVRIDDTGCTPFASTTASFSMTVGVGQVVVVNVLRDGVPSLIPVGGKDFNPDHPALPTVIYNEFTSLQFVVAGGLAPYKMDLYDDPTIPNDGALPLGVSIPPNSTSLVGAAGQVGPGGGPFLCSFRVTDKVGEVATFTAYWKVDTPAIIVASEGLAGGQAGVQYSDRFILAGGVPPFVHEFVEDGLPPNYTSDVNPNPTDPNADVLYNPGGPPTVNPSTALVKIDASYYPAPTDLGPGYDATNQGVPPEGMYVVEDTGNVTGIPRRRGTFSVNYHARSALVPNSFGQHAWATFGFSIQAAPPVVQNPAYTLAPVFSPVPPYAQIVGADQGRPYNPDGGADGLTLLASGGVPQDGRTDAPHYSQTAIAPGETNGAFQWAIDWDPDSEGNGPVPGMELTASGIWRIQAGQMNNLVPMFQRALGFTAIDFALPTQLATTRTEKVRFEIGPDKAILTQSNTAFSPNYDNRAMNDTALTLKALISYSSGGDILRAIDDTDLVGDGTGKIGVPTDAGSISIGNLLSSMDLTRVSINPTGYWDDSYHLNPKAARPFQHGDRNSASEIYGLGSYGYYYYSHSSSYAIQYQHQPTAVSLRLPKTPTVTADHPNGVYNNGGKLYPFETSSHIGIFIIRPDGRIYVPVAFNKSSTGWVSFGDAWTEGYNYPGQSNSAVKIPQMTVSPDGRFAALKLRTDTSYDLYEEADTTAILLISLTGERISAWDGEVYKIIETGSNGSSGQGQYQFASSLTLTNQYLYYLIGSGDATVLHFKDHYIYRYDLFSGDDGGALLHSNYNSEWTNASGSPMQTPFQDYYSGFNDYSGPGIINYSNNGHNCMETSYAPHPFRVSANGNACAILAAVSTGETTSGTNILKHHVWIDYEGDLHQLSSIRRRTSGGGRLLSLCSGPFSTPDSVSPAWITPATYSWGGYDGPTTRFEISDDGLKVAVAYNRSTTVYGVLTSYSTNPVVYRSDIAAYATTAASEWGSHATHEITGDATTSTSPSSAKFSPSTTWRFGALVFTADGEGLVFWGGYSNYSPTATTMSTAYYWYYGAKSYVGSIYSYDFSDGSVRNILSSSDGGCNKTVGAAFTSTSFSTSSWQTDGGVIKPFGGFISQNREFLYIATKGAINSSNYRDGTLIGVNIRSLNSSQGINGHSDGRAFVVGGFNSLNGFYDKQYYLHYYGLGYYYYYLGYNWYAYAPNYGATEQVASTDNGWVFFCSGTSAGSASTGQSSSYGGAVNTTYYSYYYSPKKLYMFDPNVGGDVQEIVGTEWPSGSTYHVVGGIDVSDDGSTVAAVWTTATYYNYTASELLAVWKGIQLDTSGDLIGSPTRYDMETSPGCVSSHFSFTPNQRDLLYGYGGSENGKTLKSKPLYSGGSAKTYSFGGSNFNVLHASGR